MKLFKRLREYTEKRIYPNDESFYYKIFKTNILQQKITKDTPIIEMEYNEVTKQ
jgi:hypothetical protein